MNYRRYRLQLGEALEIILYGVFLYAAVNKLIFPLKFTAVLLRLSLIPEWLVEGLAVTVPLLEIALVVMGFFRGLRKLSYQLLLALLIMFTIYLVGQWINDPNNACGCGGILDSFTIQQHIAFNFMLILAAGYLIHMSRD